jgi:EpsI family protein
MSKGWQVLVPILLVTQAAAVQLVAQRERLPALPGLVRTPRSISGWQMLHDNPAAPDVIETLRADELLSRTYIQSTGGVAADLLVAWFRSQRGGASQPHSPQVCLPGAGWTPQSTGEIALDTEAGPITVRKYIVANRDERAVVLYWYQTHRRVVSGEWEAKFWLVPDAIWERRTDVALVRIVVASTAASDQRAVQIASDFAKKLFPLLRREFS